MEKNQFMAILALQGKSLSWLAEEINMPISTLYQRVNNQQQWRYIEMIKLKEVLKLSPEQMMLIFPDLFAG